LNLLTSIQDGGFLQWGTPNSLDLRAFLSASPIKCIIVAPAYRLNIFGFLASSNLPTSAYSANAGFWDQRAALQWTFENISYFGGNASNITLAGYSAGSHSVFHQLAYDLSVPDDKAIVKRAMMLSNGPGVQPKSPGEAQGQYTELLSTLSIPSTLPPADQLARLRSLPAKDLITATSRMTLHQFRGVSDTSFISPALLHSLSTGSFAAKMRSRNVQLMIGECAHEHFVYATWRPPSPSFSATSTRLVADYPASTVQALMRHYFPDRTLSKRFKTWQEAFGHIYADVQIHGTMRGMIKSLVDHGAGDLVHRYRIEWRAKCVDKMFPKEWGVTHSSDMALWFWGNGADLEGEEVGIARRFLEPVEKFIKGEDVEWGCRGDGKVVRVLKEGGEVVVERDGDERWDDGVRLWNKVVGSGDERAKL
jgi:carboxylesterase type B